MHNLNKSARIKSTSAGGIIYAEINKEKFILLLKRNDGYWVLPKGHKKEDESHLETTVYREIFEETGLVANEILIENKLGVFLDNTFPEEDKTVHLYAIHYTGGSLPSIVTDDAHVDAKWWSTLNPLPKLKYPYQHNAILKFINQ